MLYYLKVFIFLFFKFNMDLIKEAFKKVKKDLLLIQNQINEQKKAQDNNQQNLKQLTEFLSVLAEQNKFLIQSNKQLYKKSSYYDSILSELFTTVSLLNKKLGVLSQKVNTLDTSTHIPVISTDSTHISTDSTHIKAGNDQILGISTGNRGVPTDRQTNRQTGNSTDESSHNQIKQEFITKKESKLNPVKDAAEMLDSLDNLKKEIRLKFKRLTEQELLVFSTIYQLEEQEGQVDYRSIAQKLGLTESSIRDYVGRLIKKGIPVEKMKINNKSIALSISQDLKKVASLTTILHLREL